MCDAGTVEGDGEAEVAKLRAAVFAEPDIPGLQVAVDDALVLGVVEGVTQLQADAQCFVHRQSAALGERGRFVLFGWQRSERVSRGSRALRGRQRISALVAEAFIAGVLAPAGSA